MLDDERPAVSVVISTQARNTAYLQEAVASVLEQTFQDFEILIVFDGCISDEAEGALKCFNDSRLRWIVSRNNRGLARSLNIAIRLARAPLIARMDDDDRCLPNRLECQVYEMKSIGCDVLGSQALVIDAEGKRLPKEIIGRDPNKNTTPFLQVFGQTFLHPTVMMRKDWAVKNRYDSSWGRGQDRELWVRSAENSSYGFLDKPLLEYRRVSSVRLVQLENLRSTYRLIWRNRNRFGIWVPGLMVANSARYLLYRFRLFFLA